MSSDSAAKKVGAPTAGNGLEAASERKYLKWYNKVGYGSGDVAGNVVYVLLSAFVMIYLTDTVGLDAGVVATLLMVSRIFDGFSDLIFGTLLDRTNTRMGKARPWMLWGFVGCAVLLIAIFAIPTSLGDTAKYAWFFIAYTLLNAVFFTANNIAYSSLTALITRNGAERVQMGSIRFMFAFGTNLLIQSATVGGVAMFGGGASGWRTMAIIYALLGLAVNTLSVFSVKELPPEELEEEPQEDKLSVAESAKILVSNKYYLIILIVFLLTQIFTAMLNMGIYFMKYVLGDEDLLKTFAWSINIPLMIGLFITPLVVSRFGGMYRINIVGYVIRNPGAARGARGRLHGQPCAHAVLLRGRGSGYELAAGHAQRPYCRGLGEHLAAYRQAHRRAHVLLYLARCEGGGRSRRGPFRVAAGRRWVRREPQGPAGVRHPDDLRHVRVAAARGQRAHPLPAHAARRREGQHPAQGGGRRAGRGGGRRRGDRRGLRGHRVDR